MYSSGSLAFLEIFRENFFLSYNFDEFSTFNSNFFQFIYFILRFLNSEYRFVNKY